MISWRVARKWVSGNRLSCAIREAKKLNSRGASALINYLGEGITKREEAEHIFSEYTHVIKEIKSRHLDAAISTKPTQFCLHPRAKHCGMMLSRLLDYCKKENVFVWFDMEHSAHTQDTIGLYLELLKTYPGNIGICIQAYLKRSGRDLNKIIRRGGIVRLVKGVYIESGKIAYRKKSDIDRKFSSLMGVLFRKSARFALGTHDEKLTDAAIGMNEKYRRDVEFQMLYGVKRELAIELAKKQRVAVYVPYGRHWDNYVRRRMREAGYRFL